MYGTKSNYLIIPPELKETPSQIFLTLNNIPLSTLKSFKYLGVHLDFRLNFQNYITATEHKIS